MSKNKKIWFYVFIAAFVVVQCLIIGMILGILSLSSKGSALSTGSFGGDLALTIICAILLPNIIIAIIASYWYVNHKDKTLITNSETPIEQPKLETNIESEKLDVIKTEPSPQEVKPQQEPETKASDNEQPTSKPKFDYKGQLIKMKDWVSNKMTTNKTNPNQRLDVIPQQIVAPRQPVRTITDLEPLVIVKNPNASFSQKVKESFKNFSQTIKQMTHKDKTQSVEQPLSLTQQSSANDLLEVKLIEPQEVKPQEEPQTNNEPQHEESKPQDSNEPKTIRFKNLDEETQNPHEDYANIIERQQKFVEDKIGQKNSIELDLLEKQNKLVNDKVSLDNSKELKQIEEQKKQLAEERLKLEEVRQQLQNERLQLETKAKYEEKQKQLLAKAEARRIELEAKEKLRQEKISIKQKEQEAKEKARADREEQKVAIKEAKLKAKEEAKEAKRLEKEELINQKEKAKVLKQNEARIAQLEKLIEEKQTSIEQVKHEIELEAKLDELSPIELEDNDLKLEQESETNNSVESLQEPIVEETKLEEGYDAPEVVEVKRSKNITPEKKRWISHTPFEEIYVYAPFDGKAMALNAVPDELFNQGEAGEGLAIEPSSFNVKSIVKNGQLKNINETNNIYTFDCNGIEIELNLGVESDGLSNKTFNVQAQTGLEVDLDTEIVSIKPKKLNKAKSTISPIVVPNLHGREIQCVVYEDQQVKQGDLLFIIK